jgi:hypothetical protein
VAQGPTRSRTDEREEIRLASAAAIPHAEQLYEEYLAERRKELGHE